MLYSSLAHVKMINITISTIRYKMVINCVHVHSGIVTVIAMLAAV